MAAPNGGFRAAKHSSQTAKYRPSSESEGNRNRFGVYPGNDNDRSIPPVARSATAMFNVVGPPVEVWVEIPPGGSINFTFRASRAKAQWPGSLTVRRTTPCASYDRKMVRVFVCDSA